ncbi:VCBS repeat-containing protein [Candidimonas sp. SYP-B2681]|uniref:FG-GAP-like repeat-containing protein n=1 Tax=Candidimonas sp. SYP-B2681 TaxID=2497686 RepID=UPI000F88E32F|nr:FG-GAP-like repeat-containing protein [Candidimonas sp. SYP-B2681]RTZ43175.1 VCBS repeat-containing protein [Candidimonas sp. SYP-B2681]
MSFFQKHLNLSSKPYLGASADQLKAGDFNNDGHTDFVVAQIHSESLGSTPAQLQVFMGDGKGGFSDQTDTMFASGLPWINYVARMIVADFNGDNVDDIFAIDNGIDKPPFTGGQNKLFLSSGGKLLDATHNLPQGMKNNHGASAGDIDNDGDLDILVNALMNDGNDLQINDGNGVFRSAGYLLPDLTMVNPWSGVGRVVKTNTWSGLIDVNNDGWLDMILGGWDNGNAGKTELYLNDGKGSFAHSTAIPLPPTGIPGESIMDIKSIDLNGDALPDLALSITSGGSADVFYHTPYMQLLVNKGDGVFVDETALRYAQSTAPQPLTMWYKSLEIIDLNRDGYPDILMDDQNMGSTILLNDGKGRFAKVLELPEGRDPNMYVYSVVAAGDFNGDTMPDLVLSIYGGYGGFDVYLNQLSGPSGLGKLNGKYDDSAMYRFYNKVTGTHFYSGSKQEVESVLLSMPDFSFDGPAFKKSTVADDLVDVFRFYNTQTGTHLYTANRAEADNIRATLPVYDDEGVAYRAHAEQSEGTAALYRFFNTESGTHFYTANAAEMESVKIQLAGTMSFEGIAYYVDI